MYTIFSLKIGITSINCVNNNNIDETVFSEALQLEFINLNVHGWSDFRGCGVIVGNMIRDYRNG